MKLYLIDEFIYNQLNLINKMSFIQKPIQNPEDNPYLDWIKSGEKQFEGRLKTKISEWKLDVGKEIKFFDQSNENSWVLCKITSLYIFSDFGTAFDELGSTLIPGKTRDEVIKLYNDLFHYSDEIIEEIKEGDSSKMIQTNGVVAIGVEIISYEPK